MLYENVKIYWKYFLLPDDEANEVIESRFTDTIAKSAVEKGVVTEKLIKEQVKEEIVKKKEDDISEVVKLKRKVKSVKKEQKKIKGENVFVKKIRDYLLAKDIELVEVISEKKKEFVAHVRGDLLFGKQEFYLVAKDKKTISDNDLTVALQQAQGKKMPAFFLSEGKLNKKGEEYIKEWGNLVRFEKIDI